MIQLEKLSDFLITISRSFLVFHLLKSSHLFSPMSKVDERETASTGRHGVMNDVYLLFLIHNYEWPLSTWKFTLRVFASLAFTNFHRWIVSAVGTQFSGDILAFSKPPHFFLHGREIKKKVFLPSLLPSSSLLFLLSSISPQQRYAKILFCVPRLLTFAWARFICHARPSGLT